MTEQNSKGYRRLVVWQKAHALALHMYAVTREFPKDEMFGLTSQMRRSAVSVPANVVEGYARASSKEKNQFLHIARGSLAELEYYLDLTLDLGYISHKQHNELINLRNDTGRVLHGFIRSIKL